MRLILTWNQLSYDILRCIYPKKVLINYMHYVLPYKEKDVPTMHKTMSQEYQQHLFNRRTSVVLFRYTFLYHEFENCNYPTEGFLLFTLFTLLQPNYEYFLTSKEKLTKFFAIPRFRNKGFTPTACMKSILSSSGYCLNTSFGCHNLSLRTIK